MAVYNGAAFLERQLQSLLEQEHQFWSLITSDDGSKDESPQILQRFAEKVEKTMPSANVSNLKGPMRGASENFMFLLRQINRRDRRCWIAFSDQDDVWLPDRLSRGLAALSELDTRAPALYCSSTWITSNDLMIQRLSALPGRPASFKNAIVQNIASGNTILLNPAASQLVCTAAENVSKVVVHDWWVYQLISGAGGNVVFDTNPTLLYRQHSLNQIGANDRILSRAVRFAGMLRGNFRKWNEINIAALRQANFHLASENRVLLERFAKLPRLPLMARLVEFSKLGLYRQTAMSNFALWVAVILRRF